MYTLTTFPVLFFSFSIICFSILTGVQKTASGQSRSVVLEEDFESLDLSGSQDSPEWTGDTSDFTFFMDGNRTLLQLSTDPVPYHSQIRTPLSAVYGSWEFWFRQDFTASNLNRGFIFLIADRPDLNYLEGSRLNGYAIRTGENGEPKKIRLVRFDNGSQQEILTSETELKAGTDYRVRVDRDLQGEWQISTSSGYESALQPDSETVTDTLHTEPGYFGLLLRYTTANISGFFFDDIRITKVDPPLSADSVGSINPRTLDIYFNRSPDPRSLSVNRFHLENSPRPESYERIDDRIVRLHFREPLRGGPDKLTIDGVSDMSGVVTDSSRPLEILITFAPEPGDLVINEILYDPIREDSESASEQSEYIEIYNRQNHAISLTGFHLRDQPSWTESATILEPPASEGLPPWIPGNEYMILYPETDDLQNFGESRIARFFGLPAEKDSLAIRFNRMTLGLLSAGTTVVLSDKTGTVIDRVDYQPDWHNPNLIDTRGISLERVNPDISSDDPANWGSSSHLQGGSPGEENTLYQVAAESPENTGLTLAPNPFSPDGDGREDHLLINYRLDDPNYMIRARIFDRYGRQVRTLSDSQPAGYQGSLIWDGRTDQGRFVRIGIYIIIFEATHSMSGKNIMFRETAVVARQF